MGLSPFGRRFLLMGLEATPEILGHFTAGIASDDPIWDHRPDPVRFTMREIVAHLADFESIFKGRMELTAREESPRITPVDEGELVISHDYAHTDPHAQVAAIGTRREATLTFLRGVDESTWEKPAFREGVGDLTLSDQAVMVLGHDGYHLRQMAQWLKSSRV